MPETFAALYLFGLGICCGILGTLEVQGWRISDSGRLSKSGDDPSSAPCEASQSGDAESGASPNPSPQ